MVFGEAERDDGFIQSGAGAHPGDAAIESGGLATNRRPQIVHEGIVHHADLALETVLGAHFQGDAHGGMRDSVGEIHGAVDGVHDPAGNRLLAGRVNPFFTQHGDGRKGFGQCSGDEFLAQDIQLELDVVLMRLVHLLGTAQVFFHQFPSLAGRRHGCGQRSGVGRGAGRK